MSLSLRLDHAAGAFRLEAAFDAPPGVTVLFGRSGAGKSTVVKAVAGLVRPDAGRIALDATVLLDTDAGVALPPHRRRLGVIFQEGRLFPHLTVRSNLLFGRWFAPRDARRESVDRVVEMLGIGALLGRRPAGLSGGEKQRVAIGRALLAAPRMLLADEPLAALDDARKAEILPYFELLRDELSIPILYVTHSVAEAARLATTVVALKEGRVTRVGPAAAVFADPEIVPAMGVREAGAILACRIAARSADGIAEAAFDGGVLLLPDPGRPVGAELRVRVAAQDVILARARPDGISALNILEARVAALQQGRGPGVLVVLTVGREQLLARITQRSAAALRIAVGDACVAIVKSVSVAPLDGGR